MKCISIFKCNHQVEVIDRSHCSLTDVPNFQNYSRSLEELMLDANQIKLLTKPLFRLTKLRRLNVSDNRIQAIPPDLANLINLVELDCSRNDIENIPEQIKFLRGLQCCDFSANSIQELPSGLVQLRNLTVLTLNNNMIKTLPRHFGQLKRLESLELRENEIEELPESFTSLSSLKRLDLGRNLLIELPENIGELSNLEELLVDGNEILSLPTQIGLLKKLQCLDASEQIKTKLKFVPEEIGGLISLTDLHLSDNEIDYIPDSIGLLQKLLILKIDSNELEELNPAIGACVSLQELVLTENGLRELPPTIGKLTQLTSLNVDHNHLQYIPPDIGNLNKLGILSLRDNDLTYLPDEIGHLNHLKVLDVAGNKLEYLPISVTALNLSALWLSENQSQPLLRFQTDELTDGTKILTCYLLPQINDQLDEKWQAQAPSSDPEPRPSSRSFAVKFDDVAQDEQESDGEAQFVRHDTPHPKELKARHQKFMAKEDKQHKEEGTERVEVSRSHEVSTVMRQASEESRVPISSANYDDVDRIASISERDRFVQSQPDQDKTSTSQLHRRDTPHHQENQRINHLTQDQRDRSSNSQILVVQVNLVGTGLGLSIAGGKGTPPFRDDDEGIFVSRVTPGGPTEAAGVKVGDKILAVNDQTFTNDIEHPKAVEIFKRVRSNKSFTLELMRDMTPVVGRHHTSKMSESPITNLAAAATKPNGSVLNQPAPEGGDSNDAWTTPFTRSYSIPVKPNTETTQTINNLRQSLMGYPGRRDNRTDQVTAYLARGLFNDNSLNKHIIYTTLIRDSTGLGIEAEHKGPEGQNETDDGDIKPGTSNVVISKINPGSVAARDGKLQVGDLILSINGVDVAGIDKERVTSLLTGTERFVRIVVSRGDAVDPIDIALRNMPSRPPLGSWYSSSSYMSHRPSLTGSYRRPTFGSAISGLSNDLSGAGRTMANSTAGIPSLLPLSSAHNRSATIHARLQGLRSQESPTSSSPSASVPSQATTTTSTSSQFATRVSNGNDTPSALSISGNHPQATRSFETPAIERPITLQKTISTTTTSKIIEHMASPESNRPQQTKKPPTPPKPRGLLPTKPEDPEVLSFTEKKRRFEQQELRHSTSMHEQVGVENTEQNSRLSDAERRAQWRRERLKSLDDDIQLAQALGNRSAATINAASAAAAASTSSFGNDK